MDDGPWTMDHGRWTMDDGPWTMNRDQGSGIRDQIKITHYALRITHHASRITHHASPRLISPFQQFARRVAHWDAQQGGQRQDRVGPVLRGRKSRTARRAYPRAASNRRAALRPRPACVRFRAVQQRLIDPSLQQARAHRRAGAVEQRQQRAFARSGRGPSPSARDCSREGIKRHICFGSYTSPIECASDRFCVSPNRRAGERPPAPRTGSCAPNARPEIARRAVRRLRGSSRPS